MIYDFLLLHTLHGQWSLPFSLVQFILVWACNVCISLLQFINTNAITATTHIFVIGGTLAIAPPVQLTDLLVAVTMDHAQFVLVSLLLFVQCTFDTREPTT